jgi:hypothetical protein
MAFERLPETVQTLYAELLDRADRPEDLAPAWEALSTRASMKRTVESALRRMQEDVGPRVMAIVGK